MLPLEKKQMQTQEIPMRPANIAAIDARIEKIETRLNQEKAKKQAAENRQRAALTKATRTAETRRKILVGAIVLKKFMQTENPWPISELKIALDSELTRLDDRALFSDLISLEKDNQK